MIYYINVYDLKPPFDRGYAWPSKEGAIEAANYMKEYDTKLLYRIRVKLK